MPEPLGPVTIGLREVYDAVMRLTGTVERLAAQHDDTARQLSDHEARLRTLERSRWPLPSLAALVSIAALIVAAAALVER